MDDKVLRFLREARAAILEEQEMCGKSREGAIQLTHIDTAILWRQEETRLKAPVVNECAEISGAAANVPPTKQGRLEDSTQICPHFDRWTIFGSKGEVMYRIPACINQGKLLPC